MAVSGIDATYYTVTDLDRATTFYAELIGAPPTMHIPNVVSEWTFTGGESFGLYFTSDPGSFAAAGSVMFAVPDVPSIVDELKAKGVEFRGDIEETPVCHMAFATDPDGNNFIVHKRK